MDLCEEERYAAAALFTLALHSTQVDAGSGRRNFREKVPGGWGEPSPQVLDRFLEGREKHPELDGPAWDAFWGWDCCGPDGLLDRVYQQLQLPERTWPGLKKLPEVAYGDCFEEFMDLVKTYMAVLDTSLPMPPKRKKKRRKRSTPLLSATGTQSIDALIFGRTQTQSRAVSRRGTGSGSDLYKITGGNNGHLIIRGTSDAAEAFQPAQPLHKELADSDDEDQRQDEKQQQEVRDELFDDCMDSGGDSDLEGDLKRAQLRETFEPAASMVSLDGDAISTASGVDSRPATPGLDPEGSGSGRPSSSSGRGRGRAAAAAAKDARVSVQLFAKQLDDPEGGAPTGLVAVQFKVVEASPRLFPPPGSSWSPTTSVCTEAPDMAAVTPQPPSHPEPSQKALAAMWELLEGCLALAHPELEKELQERKLAQLEATLQEAHDRQHQQQQQQGEPSTSGANGSTLLDAPSADRGVLQEAASELCSSAPASSVPVPGATGPKAATAAAGLAGRPPSSSGGGSAVAESTGRTPAGDAHPLQPAVESEEAAGDGLLAADVQRSDAPAVASTSAAAVPAAGGSDSKGDTSAGQKAGGEESTVAPLMPRVRWYDARARVAVKRLSHWLNVPWSRVSNFEMLLGYQLQTGERQRPILEVDAWTKSKRWAKVSTIALAGGGVFALVGGLVMAPMLVASLPFFAATAGASAFFGSAGGIAALSSTMGVLGVMDAGARAKRRTQYDINEFGFMEVRYQPREPAVLPSSEDSEVDPEEKSAHGKGADGEEDVKLVSRKVSAVEQEAKAAAEAVQGLVRVGSASSIASSSHSDDATPADGAATRNGSGAPTSIKAAAGEGAAAAAAAAPAPVDAGHLDPGHLTLMANGAGPMRPIRPTRQLTNGTGPERLNSMGESERLLGSGGASSSAVTPAKNSLASWFSFGRTASMRSSADAEASGSGQGAASADSARLLTPREQRKADKAAAKKEKEEEKEWWKHMKKEELLVFPLKKSRATANRGGGQGPTDSNMSVVIAVNGWIRKREDFLTQWATLHAPDSDVFSLIWESKELIQLNYALGSFFLTQVAQQTAQTAASKLLLGPLVAAVAPAIALNTASGVLIDNAWAVMVERSIKAGKLLAHTLMTGGHGDRPVVLVGYSMGARLVFHCLLELCRHNCKGIVEHAVMLGMPVSVRPERWRMARSVVAGRFVNGYSRNDWVLQVVYRTSKGFIQAAGGLGPVNLPGIENVNLTGLIDGHFSYMKHIDEVMDLINLWPRDQK